MKRLVALAAVIACGGAESSSLFQDASVVTPGDDASTPVDDATAPDDVATQPDVAPPTKDASPPKDSGNPYIDPGIACGNTDCDPSKNLCCGTITSYYPQYTYAFACEPLSDLVQCAAGVGVYCDDDHDCPNNGVCCGDLDSQNHYAKVSCKATCTGTVWPYTQVHFCDPKNPKCDTSQKCTASTSLPGYYVCQ
jgi:hypothetical protein